MSTVFSSGSTITHLQDPVFIARRLCIRQLYAITLALSAIVIGLLTCGLFAVTSAPIQLLIWIVSCCLTLVAWACACYRYFLLNSIRVVWKPQIAVNTPHGNGE
ncbi:hypothetical protein [Chlamydia pecorum]|uniref:Uncharacterized protein n=1 Tax=Chlamydia pecorum TaxID=85991 RepID=A0AA40PQ11_9CHLA|nr:hypothetical protein [Chlamydia pecorum]AGW37849.1 hypothetical protein CPE1_0351 [Chlamydia pecorum PV3056/3]ETF38193.1 hypothetical protein CpecG_0610 [Chlamydia pecorum MC/MarsBar]ETF40163.1 hypothetical protein CpecA_0611 [Chlamydia pecorum IPTaLE]KTF28581.1 hypothetical protein cpL1_0616 [Chlamydia pecorum]KZN26874.1 hypothetical protein cpL71_0731 [Chlamydia pecorum]